MDHKESPMIEFIDVSKTFSINQTNQLRSFLLGKKNLPLKINVSQHLNFQINKGEIVGLYGPNGSGKSTVLRLAAGILQPDSGKVIVRGSIASVIELGSGLHYDLTGNENIDLYATILGIPQEKIFTLKNKVIKFSGIGNFIDIPMKFYSSGMKSKLATSIALFADTDILLLDEVISVGDTDFREKFMRKIKKIKRSKAILFITHDIGLLQHLSDKILLIDRGNFQNTENEIAIWKIQKMPIGKKFYGRVKSNSMYPFLKRGDNLTIIKNRFSEIRKDDIIAFTLPNMPQVVVHRVDNIYEKGGNSYCITRGDSSIGLDTWKVTRNEYLGKVIPSSLKE